MNYRSNHENAKASDTLKPCNSDSGFTGLKKRLLIINIPLPVCLIFSLYMIISPVVSTAQNQAPDISVDNNNKSMNIEVKNKLLSVELRDAEFGKVMETIAAKAGFIVEIYGDSSSKKVSTSFTGVDIERAIGRLLSLVREKNYTYYYDEKGRISKLEIFGGPVPEKQPQTPVRHPVSQKPAIMPVQKTGSAPLPKPSPLPATVSPVKSLPQPLQGSVPKPVPAAPSKPDVWKEPSGEQNDEDIMDDIPYIPPKQLPAYIPQGK